MAFLDTFMTYATKGLEAQGERNKLKQQALLAQKDLITQAFQAKLAGDESKAKQLADEAMARWRDAQTEETRTKTELSKTEEARKAGLYPYEIDKAKADVEYRKAQTQSEEQDIQKSIADTNKAIADTFRIGEELALKKDELELKRFAASSLANYRSAQAALGAARVNQGDSRIVMQHNKNARDILKAQWDAIVKANAGKNRNLSQEEQEIYRLVTGSAKAPITWKTTGVKPPSTKKEKTGFDPNKIPTSKKGSGKEYPPKKRTIPPPPSKKPAPKKTTKVKPPPKKLPTGFTE